VLWPSGAAVELPTLPGLRREQLEADDAGDDEDEAEDAPHFARFTQEHHAENRRADGADAGPDGVASPDGNRLQREREEEEAHGHGRDGANARPESREAVRVFQADGPSNFEQAGEEEIEPGHRFSDSLFVLICEHYRAEN